MARKSKKAETRGNMIPQPYPLWAALTSAVYDGAKQGRVALVIGWREGGYTPSPILAMPGGLLWDCDREEHGEFRGDTGPDFFPTQEQAQARARELGKQAREYIRRAEEAEKSKK